MAIFFEVTPTGLFQRANENKTCTLPEVCTRRHGLMSGCSWREL